ncbi:unnamed protein product, partial [Iphiclides podalirius]
MTSSLLATFVKPLNTRHKPKKTPHFRRSAGSFGLPCRGNVGLRGGEGRGPLSRSEGSSKDVSPALCIGDFMTLSLTGSVAEMGPVVAKARDPLL